MYAARCAAGTMIISRSDSREHTREQHGQNLACPGMPWGLDWVAMLDSVFSEPYKELNAPPRSVLFHPSPYYTSDGGCLNPAGYFFFSFLTPSTNLIQMVDPRLPGVLGLGEAACFPGSWGGVPTCPWGTVC